LGFEIDRPAAHVEVTLHPADDARRTFALRPVAVSVSGVALHGARTESFDDQRTSVTDAVPHGLPGGEL
jgi:hypothetical protein